MVRQGVKVSSNTDSLKKTSKKIITAAAAAAAVIQSQAGEHGQTGCQGQQQHRQPAGDQQSQHQHQQHAI
jgi:hypothetical protein